MPLADCLRPFNQSDRHKVQPLINELRQAVGDDHLLGIQTELFEVLVKIVGNLPLSSSSGYFWPGSYIDFSLKLSSIALNLLRQRIQERLLLSVKYADMIPVEQNMCHARSSPFRNSV